ncbi:GNAT family N-acetyltransferase [Prochlorococcus marinus]|uniref:GNAT family N-acetyltransferase n=1 Tax=Prochlorococcus marinus TaxID=1219 RepID=UPI0022B3FB36|nr:GNAT family N-acetyltransferase [Prochlorococcus marinus]
MQTQVLQLKIKHLDLCVCLDLITLHGIWNKNQWRSALTDPSRICLGIIKHEKLIGISCGYLVLDELDITFVAVHPLYRKQGEGKRLISSLLDRATINGAKTAFLEVKEDNSAAILLYKSLDFTKISCREKYYKDHKNAFIYKRVL